MTRQTSRLTSLTQPPAALNGHWGIRVPQQVRFSPTTYFVNATSIDTSWLTVADATSGSASVTFSTGSGNSNSFDKTDYDAYVNYSITQSFFQYDTSLIGSTRTVLSASFKLFNNGFFNGLNATPVFELYPFDFGATIEAADYRNRAWLSTNSSTLAASASYSMFSAIGLKTFTNNSTNLINAINKTGMTRFVLTTDYQRVTSSEPITDVFAYLPFNPNYCFLELTYA